MKSIIQRLSCAALLATLILGVMASVVLNLFEDGNAVNNALPSFSPLAAVTPDGDTYGADLPNDISDPDMDVSIGVDFDVADSPIKEFFNYPSWDGKAPVPTEDKVVITTPPVTNPAPTPDNNTGSNNNGQTNVGDITTTLPNVSGSALAYTIKSHTYSVGLDIFQSSRNDIPVDTTALMNAINKGYNKCSFIAVRISDGATIAYNANALYRCASSYKALASLYTYKQAEAGVYNLNTTLTYTAADYYSGSGVIKGNAFGTKFSLKTVADYSIRYSDNIAFTMLQRYVGQKALSSYAATLGCPNYQKFANTNWPDVSAIDEALWWAEIYNFASSSSYGKQLYNVFLSATNPIINKALGGEHAVAHKSGSMSYYFHDAGIVHSEDPYLLVVLTHNPTNYSNTNTSYVYPLIQEIDKLINP